MAIFTRADHRIREQFLWRRPFGSGKRNIVILRFRVEQQLLARKSLPDYDEVTEWILENTFRYQSKVNVALTRSHSLRLYD